MWAVLVVGFDVGHVYSTVWRTYFDPREFQRRRTLYLLAPLLGWLGFAALYSLGSMVFWRVLAYLAVFHFVRQQYGFMMIYRRQERRYRRIDQAAIYMATLWPLLWWHTHTRHFVWFVDGDFVSLPLPGLSAMALAVFVVAMSVYIGKEILIWRSEGTINLPRNALLIGTALSWWTGIVWLDSDLAFTATNVVAHGVPYMALVWLYGRSQARDPAAAPILGFMPARLMFSAACVPLFLAVPVLLAWIEEGFWDGFVWNEHPGLFAPFAALPSIDDNPILTWLVPLLALPQITHYILDAFIWRLRGPETAWRRPMFVADPVVRASFRPLSGPAE